MLTLLATVLATAYFVVPDLLSRFVLGFFLVRKTVSASRGEELMRAAFWALAPIGVAWCTRNEIWWQVPHGSGMAARTVFSALYSDKYFNDHSAEFFPALALFQRANLCFLSRAYLTVILASVLLGILARNFGIIRVKVRRIKVLSTLLHWAVLPRISEWHVALSPMLLHDPKQYSIEIDVMTKNGTLYRGSVQEKIIASDGTLQTLLLNSPDRYLHADFTRDRAEYASLTEAERAIKPKPSSSNYWRKIPGELFLLVGSEITSVNVRHVSTMSSVKPMDDTNLKRLMDELTELLEQRLGS